MTEGVSVLLLETLYRLAWRRREEAWEAWDTEGWIAANDRVLLFRQALRDLGSTAGEPRET